MGLAMILSGLQAATVRAIPPLPCTFWGTVYVDGASVLPGSVVSVWSGGVRWAETRTETVGTGEEAQVLYAVDVPGDDPETPQVEGPPPGAALQFRIYRPHVGGLPAIANETATWQSTDQAIELNLTATQPVPACVLHLPQVGLHYHWGAGQ